MTRQVCYKIIIHIFLSIISPDNSNLSIKLIDNQIMEVLETSENFMLTPKHVDPCHTSMTVNKSDKPLKPT